MKPSVSRAAERVASAAAAIAAADAAVAAAAAGAPSHLPGPTEGKHGDRHHHHHHHHHHHRRRRTLDRSNTDPRGHTTSQPIQRQSSSARSSAWYRLRRAFHTVLGSIKFRNGVVRRPSDSASSEGDGATASHGGESPVSSPSNVGVTPFPASDDAGSVTVTPRPPPSEPPSAAAVPTAV